MKKIKKAIIFPGQGSQHTKMGEESFSIYQKEAQRASDLAGFDLQKMCLQPENTEKLNQTIHTQPCLYWTSFFSQELAKQKGEIPPSASCIFAGHSLGEYVALAVSKVFDWETGFKIVVKRAQLMDKSAKKNNGTMAAVLGLEYEKIKKIIKDIDAVEIANYNCLLQTVLSGEKNAIDNAAEILKQNGAKRVVPLAVSGAFHSSQMKNASVSFSAFLDKINLNAPEEIVYSNVTKKKFPNTPQEIKKLMIRQIEDSVLWQPMVVQMASENDLEKEDFIEIGPGKILTNLVARCF